MSVRVLWTVNLSCADCGERAELVVDRLDDVAIVQWARFHGCGQEQPQFTRVVADELLSGRRSDGSDAE